MATLPAPLNTPSRPPFFGALLRRPPHDPNWFLLNGASGWRAGELTRLQQEAVTGALSLAPAAGTARNPAEPSGSFGGVRLPANVTQAPDCALILLDRSRQVLRRFDASNCGFTDVPCYGREGSGARELNQARAIAVCGGNLYVCDTCNHRVVVLALNGFAIRASWRPPLKEIAKVWEPVDLAFDGAGNAYVGDAANNCVHVFAPSGVWLRKTSLAGSPVFVALDCTNNLYIVLEGELVAHVFTPAGFPLPDIASPGDLTGRFPAPPAHCDSRGNLDLSAFCCDPEGTDWFDPDGNPLPSPPPPEPPQFKKDGVFLSQALDSELYRCQWHRVVITAQVPRGSRVLISTYTTEADVPLGFVEDLPDSVWQTRQTVLANQAGWDCMIRSGPGRFLWLRLQLFGNGSVSPAIEAVHVEFPRISLRRFLPAVFGEDPTLTDFTDRFLAIFDTALRSIESEIDNQARFFDPQSTPATTKVRGGIDFLTWLAGWLGLRLDRGIPEQRRRAMLAAAGRIYPIRGTLIGLQRALLVFMGLLPKKICCSPPPPRYRCTPDPLNCRRPPDPQCNWQEPTLILEHYKLRRWLFAGAGRLGEQSRLWGERIAGRVHLDHGAPIGETHIDSVPDGYRDPFFMYAHKFTVFMPAKFDRTKTEQRALMNLLRAESPANTQYDVQFVAARFRIGFQSIIGLDSVVGRYPAGLTLGETPLGPASVLDASPRARGGPSMQVGVAARIGSTTRLE